MSIAGFILALLGLIFGIVKYNSFVFQLVFFNVSLIGLILSSISMRIKKSLRRKPGLSVAGLVIGILAVLVTAVFLFLCTIEGISGIITRT